MLSPRLTNCPECANIPSLLKKIDCKLAELGNNLYNNISYMLNKQIPTDDIIQLIGYRRILQYKYINPNYAHRYTINMIASRVIRLTVGCVSKCNTPLPCKEIFCDITIVPNPTTTTTTTLFSNNYIITPCINPGLEFIIQYDSEIMINNGVIVKDVDEICYIVIDRTTDLPNKGTIINIFSDCDTCYKSITTTTTTIKIKP